MTDKEIVQKLFSSANGENISLNETDAEEQRGELVYQEANLNEEQFVDEDKQPEEKELYQEVWNRDYGYKDLYTSTPNELTERLEGWRLKREKFDSANSIYEPIDWVTEDSRAEQGWNKARYEAYSNMEYLVHAVSSALYILNQEQTNNSKKWEIVDLDEQSGRPVISELQSMDEILDFVESKNRLANIDDLLYWFKTNNDKIANRILIPCKHGVYTVKYDTNKYVINFISAELIQNDADNSELIDFLKDPNVTDGFSTKNSTWFNNTHFISAENETISHNDSDTDGTHKHIFGIKSSTEENEADKMTYTFHDSRVEVLAEQIYGQVDELLYNDILLNQTVIDENTRARKSEAVLQTNLNKEIVRAINEEQRIEMRATEFIELDYTLDSTGPISTYSIEEIEMMLEQNKQFVYKGLTQLNYGIDACGKRPNLINRQARVIGSYQKEAPEYNSSFANLLRDDKYDIYMRASNDQYNKYELVIKYELDGEEFEDIDAIDYQVIYGYASNGVLEEIYIRVGNEFYYQTAETGNKISFPEFRRWIKFVGQDEGSYYTYKVSFYKEQNEEINRIISSQFRNSPIELSKITIDEYWYSYGPDCLFTFYGHPCTVYENQISHSLIVETLEAQDSELKMLSFKPSKAYSTDYFKYSSKIYLYWDKKMFDEDYRCWFTDEDDSWTQIITQKDLLYKVYDKPYVCTKNTIVLDYTQYDEYYNIIPEAIVKSNSTIYRIEKEDGEVIEYYYKNNSFLESNVSNMFGERFKVLSNPYLLYTYSVDPTFIGSITNSSTTQQIIDTLSKYNSALLSYNSKLYQLSHKKKSDNLYIGYFYNLQGTKSEQVIITCNTQTLEKQIEVKSYELQVNNLQNAFNLQQGTADFSGDDAIHYPTMKAVYDYVQSVLPFRVENLETNQYDANGRPLVDRIQPAPHAGVIYITPTGLFIFNEDKNNFDNVTHLFTIGGDGNSKLILIEYDNSGLTGNIGQTNYNKEQLFNEFKMGTSIIINYSGNYQYVIRMTEDGYLYTLSCTDSTQLLTQKWQHSDMLNQGASSHAYQIIPLGEPSHNGGSFEMPTPSIDGDSKIDLEQIEKDFISGTQITINNEKVIDIVKNDNNYKLLTICYDDGKVKFKTYNYTGIFNGEIDEENLAVDVAEILAREGLGFDIKYDNNIGLTFVDENGAETIFGKDRDAYEAFTSKLRNLKSSNKITTEQYTALGDALKASRISDYQAIDFDTPNEYSYISVSDANSEESYQVAKISDISDAFAYLESLVWDIDEIAPIDNDVVVNDYITMPENIKVIVNG